METARVTARFSRTRRKWQTRVTFDVPWRGGVMKDGLEWSPHGPTSRSLRRVVRKSVSELLKERDITNIEIVIAKEEA